MLSRRERGRRVHFVLVRDSGDGIRRRPQRRRATVDREGCVGEVRPDGPARDKHADFRTCVRGFGFGLFGGGWAGHHGIWLTYEVEHHARPALVRPGVVLPEGVGVAVRDPKPSVEHPDVGVIRVLDVSKYARAEYQHGKAPKIRHVGRREGAHAALTRRG